MKKKKEISISKRFIENPRDLVNELNSSNEGNLIETGMYLLGKHLEELPERTRTERFLEKHECRCCQKPLDKYGNYCLPCAMGKCKH